MLTLKKRLFILILTFTTINSACWNQLPSIRTNIITAISTLTAPSTSPLSYTQGYSSNLSTVVGIKWGLGLIGYQCYMTKTFSYNITVNNVDITSISLTVQPKDSTYILKLNLYYIITTLGHLGTTKLQLKNGCFKCMNISLGQGTRTQNFDNQPALLTNTTTLLVRSFFFSFNFSNAVGQINYLKISSINNGSFYIHTFTAIQNVTISYVCISTLAWESSLDTIGAGIASMFQTHNINITIGTSTVTYYPAFDCPNLKFFGLSMLKHTMGGERLLLIHPQFYSLINTNFILSTDYNSYFDSATLQVIYIGSLTCSPLVYNNPTLSCVSSCTNNTFSNVSGSCVPCNPVCQNCSSTNPNNCTSCLSSTRIPFLCHCNIGYYETGAADCLPCRNTSANCTNCNSNTNCSACDPGMFVVNGTCRCANFSSSYLVGGICLNFPGCQTAFGATNLNYCLLCNNTANFEQVSPSNLTCRCKNGYNNSVNPQLCTSICGDGLVDTGATNCDDNNTANSDGCSSTCVIQPNYYCYVVKNTPGPSHCILISSTVISYLYAKRLTGTNKAELYFIISPANLNIPSSTFSGKITTNAPTNTINSVYDATTSKITLTVDFTSDMQGNAYSFTFDFSKLTTFYSNPVTVNIVSIGINQQLVFLNNIIFIKTMQFVLMGLSFLAIIIALVSSLAGYKLFGFELILPIQAVFFTLLTMSNPPPFISQLKFMIYSNGFNGLFTYNYDSYYKTNTKLPKFDYSVQFGLNVNIMIGLLLIATIVLLVLQILYLYHYSKALAQQTLEQEKVQQNKKGNKNKKQEKVKYQIKEEGELGLNYKAAKQRRNIFLNNFYCFLVILLIQQCFFAFITQNNQSKVSQLKFSEDINIFLCFISILIIFGTLIFFVDQCTQKKDKRALSFIQTKNQRYPIVLFCSYFILSISVAIMYTYKFAVFISVICSLIPLIILLFFRPYRSNQSILCMLTAVVDQVIIIGAASMYMVNQLIVLPEMMQLICAIVVVALIFVAQFLTIIRMVKIIPWKELELIKRCLEKNKKGQKREKGGENEDDKDKPEAQLAQLLKNNLIQNQPKMVDWQQRNQKEYTSIKSGKQQKQGEQEQLNQNSQQNQQDELMLLKRRLKKDMALKRTIN